MGRTLYDELNDLGFRASRRLNECFHRRRLISASLAILAVRRPPRVAFLGGRISSVDIRSTVPAQGRIHSG